MSKKKSTPGKKALKQEFKELTGIPLCIPPSDQPSLNDITWRIFRIMAEFIEGFQFISQFNKEVTFFGSARLKPSNKWYQESVKLAKMLGEAGFTIISGGGPGIMEAANRGAKEVGAQSVGLNIQLPNEQRINKYVKKGKGFYYFFTRKIMLSASAQAYIYFPGGYGTLDEFFEIVTLVQTGKIQKLPIVCVGKEFWAPLDNLIKKTLRDKLKTISKGDENLYTVVNTAKAAFDLVKDSKERTIF